MKQELKKHWTLILSAKNLAHTHISTQTHVDRLIQVLFPIYVLCLPWVKANILFFLSNISMSHPMTNTPFSDFALSHIHSTTATTTKNVIELCTFPFLLFILAYDFAYIASSEETSKKTTTVTSPACCPLQCHQLRVSWVCRAVLNEKGCSLQCFGTMDLHRIFWLSQFFWTVFCSVCVLCTHYTRTVWKK